MEVIQQLRRARVPDHARPGRPVGQGPRPARARSSRWRRSTAPSSSPPPTRTWACCRASARRAGTTRGASGAATTSSSCRPSRSAARSRCRCPTRPRSRPPSRTPDGYPGGASSDGRSMPRLRLPGRRRRRRRGEPGPRSGAGQAVPDAPRARPWLRPPALRTPAAGEGDERHASWLELFFDLVFVVAIAELAQELVRDHSLGGFAIFAGLFLPVFIAWQGFTFYADRFDSDDVVFRAVMLAAMLAIAALAVQIPDVAAGRHDAGLRRRLRDAALAARRALPARVAARRAGAAAGRALRRRLLAQHRALAAARCSSTRRRATCSGASGSRSSTRCRSLAQRIHARIPVDPATCRSASRCSRSSSWASRSSRSRSGPPTSDWRVASALTAGAGVRVRRLPVVGVLRPRHGRRPQQPRPARCRSTPASTSRCSPRSPRSGAGVHLLIQEAATGDAQAGAAWALDGGAALYLLCLTVAQHVTDRGAGARRRGRWPASRSSSSPRWRGR